MSNAPIAKPVFHPPEAPLLAFGLFKPRSTVLLRPREYFLLHHPSLVEFIHPSGSTFGVSSVKIGGGGGGGGGGDGVPLLVPLLDGLAAAAVGGGGHGIKREINGDKKKTAAWLRLAPVPTGVRICWNWTKGDPPLLVSLSVPFVFHLPGISHSLFLFFFLLPREPPLVLMTNAPVVYPVSHLPEAPLPAFDLLELQGTVFLRPRRYLLLPQGTARLRPRGYLLAPRGTILLRPREYFLAPRSTVLLRPRGYFPAPRGTAILRPRGYL